MESSASKASIGKALAIENEQTQNTLNYGSWRAGIGIGHQHGLLLGEVLTLSKTHHASASAFTKQLCSVLRLQEDAATMPDDKLRASHFES